MWWDSQIEEYREEVREFAVREVAPRADAMEDAKRMDPALLAAMSDFGVLRMLLPKEHGGTGSSTLEYVVAVEELSRFCGSTGITVAAANSLGIAPVLKFGSAAQHEKVFPGVANGKMIAFGLTEPDAGSDAGGTKSRAIESDGGWVLNGSKIFITNPHYADYIICTAVTEPGKGAHGISSFLVKTDTPGFRVGEKEKKLGLIASDTSPLFFDDVELNADDMLGNRGEGFKQFMITLDGGRISIGALALGLGQGALDVALAYVNECKSNGNPIAKSQAIQFKLADMATQIEAARHMVYSSAYLKDIDRPFGKQSAMAKLHASETGHMCTDAAIQIMGELGQLRASRAERLYRDVKLCEIGEGTSEIQRLVISRLLLKDAEQMIAPPPQVPETVTA